MRKVLLLLTLPTGLVVLAAAIWLLWPHTAITQENAERIEKGMTMAEVEAVFSGPARNEATGDHWKDASIADDGTATGWPEPLGSKRRPGTQWTTDGLTVRVEFENGRVWCRESFQAKTQGPLDTLRRWLRF